MDTPELLAPLSDVEFLDSPPLLLRSRQYYQVGCDLRQLSTLQRALSEVTGASTCEYLFIAEVSMTYMETAAADALIQWTSTFGDGTSKPTASGMPMSR